MEGGSINELLGAAVEAAVGAMQVVQIAGTSQLASTYSRLQRLRPEGGLPFRARRPTEPIPAMRIEAERIVMSLGR